jgi:hypothetical protein
MTAVPEALAATPEARVRTVLGLDTFRTLIVVPVPAPNVRPRSVMAVPPV